MFKFKIKSTKDSAFCRQIKEGNLIQEYSVDHLLKIKEMYNRCVIPTLVTKGRYKKKLNEDALDNSPDESKVLQEAKDVKVADVTHITEKHNKEEIHLMLCELTRNFF